MFGNTMKVYTVHINPSEKQALEKPEFVEEGFAWLAFLFTAFWAIFHRMWVTMIVLLALSGLINLAMVEQWVSPPLIVIVQLTYQIIFGFVANDLRRWKLKRDGYVLYDIVTGDSQLRAEQRFFDRYVQRMASSEAPGQTPAPA